jgi:hypothetical protein
MFRRRPKRRPLRPLHARMRPGRRRPPQELIRAHYMMESGNYQGAAEQFEAIAHIAESRDGPRAPQLYLQAGHAHLLAGQNEIGLGNVKHGLTLLAQHGDWPHLHRAGKRALAELNQRGLTVEADDISDFLKANLPGDFTAPKNLTPTKKPVLPTHCPSCGGALRPDEVDWLDEHTAECPYCGSPVREAS